MTTKDELQDAHVSVSNQAEYMMEKALPILLGDYNPLHLIRLGVELARLQDTIITRKQVQRDFRNPRTFSDET